MYPAAHVGHAISCCFTAFQEMVTGVEQYLCSGERTSMQWVPQQGPLRLQRLIMSARKDRQGMPSFTLPCPALPCPVLPHPALPRPALSRPVLPYPAPLHSDRATAPMHAGQRDWHNLQVSDAFGIRPGASGTGQGPRSCYISDEYG